MIEPESDSPGGNTARTLSAEAGLRAGSEPLAHQTIVIVDDVTTNLRILERMLRAPDREIVLESNPSNTLNQLKNRNVALVLLDVDMPGMNGFEVARVIQDNEDTRHIPIIFITASKNHDESVFKGYASGCVDFLIKPVDATILRGKVRIFCELQARENKITEQIREIEAKNQALEHEIDERRRAENAHAESEVRYRSLVELAPQAILVQVHDRIMYFNRSALQTIGASNETQILGHSLSEFVCEEDREYVREYLENIERRGGRGEPIETTIERFDGARTEVEVHAGCIMYEGDVGVQMAFVDISGRKKLERELRQLSEEDALTGIANRRNFDKSIVREWNQMIRLKRPISVLILDIDYFKLYNDTYGHQAGDDCLRKVAQALAGVIHRPSDILARYGGEEFAAVLPDTDEAGALGIAETMRQSIEDLQIPHKENPGKGIVTISIGVHTLRPVPGDSHDVLVEKADAALYRAKELGRARVCVAD